MARIRFETRPDKPERQGVVTFFTHSETQKSSGKLALQLKSRHAVLTDHLSRTQVESLIVWLTAHVDQLTDECDDSQVDKVKIQ